MAYEVSIAGTPLRAKVRSPWAVVGLGVITFGIYSLFWWYFINREMRDLGRARAVKGLGENPGLSTLAFSGLSLFTLYIALVWTTVTTTRRVRRAQAVVGVPNRLNGWLSAALWILTLTLGGMAYTQSELNKVWRAQEGEDADAVPSAAAVPGGEAGQLDRGERGLHIEDPDEWPAEHPALWDTITRRAYEKRYGKPPGS